MAQEPEYFDCEIVGRNQIHKTVDSATRKVLESDFNPTAIVGISRGGWIPARQVADLLEEDNLTSMKIDHYQGTTKTETAEIQFNTRSKAIEGEKVLLVDDIVDTGKTISKAIKDIEKRSDDARSLTVHSLPSSEIRPDYVGREFDEFYWIIYPWNIVEDMNEIIKNVIDIDETIRLEELEERLDEYHSVTEEDVSKLDYSLDDLLDLLNERNELTYEDGSIRI